jgi:hypothetical protein
LERAKPTVMLPLHGDPIESIDSVRDLVKPLAE